MSATIELKNVSFTYEDAKEPILKCLNLRLEYGELALLSGVSGEGKTTLLSIINGIIPFVNSGRLSGEVLLNGQEVSKMRISRRAKLVGTVLQNAEEQIVHDTCEDEVAFGCENFKMPAGKIEKKVVESLSFMQLQPQLPIKTLSGGQKQRLVTASTLAMPPKILILDEPLANLDGDDSRLLLNSLRNLTKQGYAVLLVEHRLDIVLPYADRVLWIQDGVLQSSTEKQALFHTEHKIEIEPAASVPGRAAACIAGHSLSFQAGGRSIINELDVTIYSGEKVVLLGENGCGKTTLLRLLARLNATSGGTLTQNILPAAKRKKGNARWFCKVGFVYQNPAYQLFMPTLLEEISYRAVSTEKAQEMIALFGLSGLENRHPHSLSEGQKRRAGIAAICAEEPEVIFLDEPTVGQDYNNLKNIVYALCQIQKKKGCTIMTVTHDIRCAGALADRVLIMENGKIKEEGGPSLADAFFTRNLLKNNL